MSTFHIRQRPPRRKGNQFYRDKSVHDATTYCGAEPTDHDISWRDKAATWADWQPCKDCIRARGH